MDPVRCWVLDRVPTGSATLSCWIAPSRDVMTGIPAPLAPVNSPACAAITPRLLESRATTETSVLNRTYATSLVSASGAVRPWMVRPAILPAAYAAVESVLAPSVVPTVVVSTAIAARPTSVSAPTRVQPTAKTILSRDVHPATQRVRAALRTAIAALASATRERGPAGRVLQAEPVYSGGQASTCLAALSFLRPAPRQAVTGSMPSPPHSPTASCRQQRIQPSRTGGY